MYPDGPAWAAQYNGKVQFHEDFKIAPMAAGALGSAYIEALRTNIRAFQETQLDKVGRSGELIAAQSLAGNKTPVPMMGHSPSSYVGLYEDKQWAEPINLEAPDAAEMANYQKTPDGAVILRLGYGGLHQDIAALMRAKKQRVILIAAVDDRPEYAIPPDLTLFIDMKWAYGDAAVSIPGYPVKFLPPSGILQIVAYECVNVEVLARLPKVTAPDL